MSSLHFCSCGLVFVHPNSFLSIRGEYRFKNSFSLEVCQMKSSIVQASQLQLNSFGIISLIPSSILVNALRQLFTHLFHGSLQFDHPCISVKDLTYPRSPLSSP